MKQWFFALAALLAIASQSRPPERGPARESDLRPLLLRPGVVSRVVQFQKPLLIELYWLRVLNAVGEPDSERKNRSLYEYGVFLSDLDPRFYTVYSYLPINVPFRVGRTWRFTELADELFVRGIRQYPTDLRLRMMRGGMVMLQARDYLKAADIFFETSKLPDAPAHLAMLSLRLRAHAGETGAALEFARGLLAETTDPEARADLEGKVRDLEVEQELKPVDDAIERFTTLHGRPPVGIEELRADGLYLGTARDSYGGTISIGADGLAHSTSLEKRVRLVHEIE